MSRLEAFGNQLVQFHIYLRELLEDLRDQVEAGEPVSVGGLDLRAHCLSFCQAVTSHHTGEDDGAFAVLAEHYPELRPVLAELTRDHHLVAGALRRIEVLDQLEPAAQEQELATLAALLETHFTYEERKLLDAFNGLSGLTPPDHHRLTLPFRHTT
ncbi:hemerythrin domain-containing protein [Kribbella ginsengisoli]|uniref:Hemerythrin-like domain-containing protein n=1 Tax=Kribbella ginsengisoli TaxID=363865 RepID=A0ABP6WBT0_9ACTN